MGNQEIISSNEKEDSFAEVYKKPTKFKGFLF
jgi:hypothetical protein